MTLEILTPEKKIYSGDVYGVQLPGIDGSFEDFRQACANSKCFKTRHIKGVKR